MLRWLTLCAFLLISLPSLASERVPGERWLRYADPAQAGFDAAELAEAEARWRQLPSSALMVIADGAVVAAWGQTQRRFMCHSVRKSFLSALFGIYWDQGRVDLNKNLADLGIDEEGDGLLEREKLARTLDLLKARSGVFHPAAYAGRTDSQPRGSQGPGRYFAYNNWDFNTLAAILEKETGDTVFKAFDEHFARPLGMEDWRISDGYFHYELDKSVYPAYPFRLSARDAARFGLLFAREGMWGDQRILSRHWVRRSTALYSIDSEQFGYGFMWWVAREPRFADHGFVAALGVGNQMIAVLPDSDLVIVNRADTYRGEGTPMDDLLDLIEQILQARTGGVAASPRLEPLEEAAAESPAPLADAASRKLLEELVGEWPYPPPSLGLPRRTTVTLTREGDHLISHSSVSGTFRQELQADGWLLEEDSRERYLPLRDEVGAIEGIADVEAIAAAAIFRAADGEKKAARGLLGLVAEDRSLPVRLSRSLTALLSGRRKAEDEARRIVEEASQPRRLGGMINGTGYRLLRSGREAQAQKIFELNTRLFPEVANAWDSLGEALMVQGKTAEAIRHYKRSLELDPDNANAEAMIRKMQEEAAS